MSNSRRAAWQAIETWSSWFALVGVESIEQGVARCRFSAINAAAVTSAIMKPELILGQATKKPAVRNFAPDRPGCDTALGDRTDFGNRQRALIGGEGYRFGVEVTAGQNRAIFDHDDRIVGDRVGLDLEGLPHLAQLVDAGTHHLRLTANAVGILYALVVFPVRFTNRRSVQQCPQAVRGVDLSLQSAQFVNFGAKGRGRIHQGIGGQRAGNQRGLRQAPGIEQARPAPAPSIPGCR